MGLPSLPIDPKRSLISYEEQLFAFGGGRGINVGSFGADASGVNDSTAAFQLAADSGYPIYVPLGNWRIDGTVVIDQGNVWYFEQGILPNYRWHANSTQAVWDRDNCGCRLFKDSASSNVPFFKVRSGWVFILGFPLLDVGLRTSFTSDGILYALGEGNDLLSQQTSFHYPRVWGGTIEVQALGNYDTIINENEGMYVVRVDWGDAPIDTNLDNAYTTKLKWDVRAQIVHTLAQIETKEAAAQWSNSGFMNLESHGAKRSLYNDGTNDIRITGYHQADNNMHLNERHLPVLYFGPNTRENSYDFEFHDLNDSPSGGARPGNYRNSVAVEDHGWKTLELLQGTARELAPVGLITRSQRKTFDTTSLGGILSTFENNVLANLSLKAAYEGGTFGWDVYAGEEVVSSTAVTDCVFANQSDDTVDITSALGGLPSFVVGAKFTLSDHSEAYNNSEYQVLSTVTDGYNCRKIQQEGFIYDPVDSASEAVIIGEDIGSLLTDSVTAGITATGEYTESGDMDLIGHSHATTFSALMFSANAVTDQDYLEYHWSGWSHALEKVVLSFAYQGRFDRIQYIGLNSGVVVNNHIFEQAAVVGSTSSRPEIIEMILDNNNVDEGILRFFGPSSSSEVFSIWDFAGIDTYPNASGHWVSQKGGQVIYGDMKLAANVDFTGLPTSDPLQAGRLWNNSGILTVSAG